MPSEAKDPKPLLALLPPAKPCPAGTAFAGKNEWMYEGVVYGHFLSAQSEDAVVSASGCEPHSDGYGGSYLLTRSANAWRVVWYKPGILTSQCSRIPLPNYQGLVCYVADIAQGTAFEVLYTLDLGKPAPERNFFFRSTDTTGASTSSPRGPMQRSRVDRIVLSGNKITILASFGMQRRYRRMQVDPGAPVDIPVSPYQVEYVLDGARFKPVPASQYNARMFSPEP